MVAPSDAAGVVQDLWMVCGALAVGAYLPGLGALLLPLCSATSTLAATVSAGLLLGAGLCVILPEGFHSLAEAQEGLSQADQLPEWVAGAALLMGFLLMAALDMLRPTHASAGEACPGHQHPGTSPPGSLGPSAAGAPSQRASCDLRSQPPLASYWAHVAAGTEPPPAGVLAAEGTAGGAQPPPGLSRLGTAPILPSAGGAVQGAVHSHHHLHATCPDTLNSCLLPACSWQPHTAADDCDTDSGSAVEPLLVTISSGDLGSSELPPVIVAAEVSKRQSLGNWAGSLTRRLLSTAGGSVTGKTTGGGACDSHAHHHDDHHHHAHGHGQGHGARGSASGLHGRSRREAAAQSALLGLVLHSAADGLAVGAAGLSGNLTVSLVIAASIMVHKVPVAYGLACFLKASGMSFNYAHTGLLAFVMAAPGTALATFYLLRLCPWASDPQVVALALLASGGTVLHAGAVHVLPSAGKRGADLLVLGLSSLVPLIISIYIQDA